MCSRVDVRVLLLMDILDTKVEVTSIQCFTVERSMKTEQLNIKQIILLCLFPHGEKFCHTVEQSDLE